MYMSKPASSEERQTRFKELATGFQPKLSPKLTEMLPFKKYILELRNRKASYEVICSLLEDVDVFVSLDTIYRFCRDVIGVKTARPYKPRVRKNPPANNLPTTPLIQRSGIDLPTPSKPRERYDGPWAKKKNVPRIANPKKL